MAEQKDQRIPARRLRNEIRSWKLARGRIGMQAWEQAYGRVRIQVEIQVWDQMAHQVWYKVRYGTRSGVAS